MLAHGIRFAFRDFANAAQFVLPALGHAVAMQGQEQAHRRETKCQESNWQSLLTPLCLAVLCSCALRYNWHDRYGEPVWAFCCLM
jgi:hypothetical protein